MERLLKKKPTRVSSKLSNTLPQSKVGSSDIAWKQIACTERMAATATTKQESHPAPNLPTSNANVAQAKASETIVKKPAAETPRTDVENASETKPKPNTSEEKVPTANVPEPRVAEPRVSEPRVAEPRVAEARVSGQCVAEPRVAGSRVADQKPAVTNMLDKFKLQLQMTENVPLFVILTGGFGRQMLQLCAVVQTMKIRSWNSFFKLSLVPYFCCTDQPC